MQTRPVHRDTRATLAELAKSRGLRALAREAGVSDGTIARAIRGGACSDRTIAKLARIAPKVRNADEFRPVRPAPLPPARTQPRASWTIEAIRAARDQQMRANFAIPVRLAEAISTDDALFVARQNRVAPQYAVESRLVPASGQRGAAVAARAASGVHMARSVLAGIHRTLADHGIAIGRVAWDPADDGTRVDARLAEWPLEFVRLDQTRDQLVTRTRSGPEVDIVHGDGEWIVFRRGAERPWIYNACLLPAALCWAAHAEGIADWNATTRAHGLAKVLGELPDGVALRGKDGALSEEASALLDMLVGLTSGDLAAGVVPAATKATWLSSGSTAWQVFSELVGNREKAAARIYTGTDAALGSVGGAPGVDIASLFGVATTIIQGDFEAIEQALNSGLLAPWAAVNFGDSRYAPRFAYQLPDPDSEAKHVETRAARERLHATLAEMREQKLEVTQAVVDALAAELGLSPAPRLSDVEVQTSSLVLAPTDIAKVVRVREARSAQGLPAFNDPRDEMTIAELDAWTAAKAAAATVPAA